MPRDADKNLDDPGKSQTNDNGGDDGQNTDTDGKVFSQEDLDRIIRERLAREQKKFDEERKKVLQELQRTKALSQKEREALTKQIEEIEERSMTEKEKAAKRQRQEEEARRQEIEAARQEAERNKSLLVENLKRQHLIAAAAKCDAYNPEQVVGLLAPHVTIEEKVNEVSGKPTGQFEINVALRTKGEDGRPLDKELPVEEAVKAFLDENPNLLKGNVVGGAGSSTSPTVDSGGRRVIKESAIESMTEEEFIQLQEARKTGDVHVIVGE